MKDIFDALDGEGAIDTHNVVEHSKSLIVINEGASLIFTMIYR
jgi:hypothetical protein